MTLVRKYEDRSIRQIRLASILLMEIIRYKFFAAMRAF